MCKARSSKPTESDSTKSDKPAAQDTPQSPRTGGRPTTTPEEEKKLREQGDNHFADPVQYGVALVNGSLVIRTGEVVYCVRNKEATP